MERTNRNDFFLEFKSVFDEDNKFIDFVLVKVSDNFINVTGLNIKKILGKKISDIVLEDEDNKLGIKDYYPNIMPKTRRKIEVFIEPLKRWYFINIFSDEKDYLIIFYTDITILNDDHFRDRLTGLYNKNFFEEELSRFDTERQLPLTIIMGDLNGLKLINDAFGHKMGDRALVKVGEIMKNAFREEDIISRIGGDEFVVLLPKTPKEVAQTIVDRIKRDCISNPLEFIEIDISFGTATKENIDEDIQNVFKKAEEKMYFNKLTESSLAKSSMIKYLRNKLEEISIESKEHHSRLKTYSLIMANELKLPNIDIEKLNLLCEYHDVGYIGIPSKILNNNGPLNIEEWEEMKRHCEIGYHILASSYKEISVDDLVLLHHERWDGKGYPRLLKDTEIPLIVRIFSIADAYESMTIGRPYKDKMTSREALLEIKNNGGTQFDPDLANLFVKLMVINGIN